MNDSPRQHQRLEAVRAEKRYLSVNIRYSSNGLLRAGALAKTELLQGVVAAVRGDGLADW